jgi:hypothetical protein
MVMKTTDPLLKRIEKFNESKGGGIIIEKIRGGYSLYLESTGVPIARLRPTGEGDDVEVKRWSSRERWEDIGDFGSIILPLDKALEYVASESIFWIRA